MKGCELGTPSGISVAPAPRSQQASPSCGTALGSFTRVMERSRPSQVAARLSIRVVGATGRGPTTLAAFDDALSACGVHNFNLVRLSSVIPPFSTVRATMSAPSTPSGAGRSAGAPSELIDLTSSEFSPIDGGWGDRLYAVWAFEGAQLLGQEAWAGVAWSQDEDGRGLFVEHEGGSEAQVREELQASLTSICQSRGMGQLEQESVVVGCRCEGEPVGALVIAPFSSERWTVAANH